MRSELENIAALLPVGLYTIREFYFDTAPGVANQGTLVLTVSTKEGSTVTLTARGVRNVEIRTGPYTPVTVTVLIITDMSKDQWPSVNCRVASEDEDTYVSFLCAELEAKTVGPCVV